MRPLVEAQFAKVLRRKPVPAKELRRRPLSALARCLPCGGGMDTNGFRRILVPTDFSPCAEAALRQAISMAKAFGGRITLVHAYLPHFYPSPPRGFVPDEEELKRLAATTERELAALCDRYAASGVAIERRALAGGAEKVVRRAKIPVLTVRG
jgi:nucleotide-binding universal stress UspA family protein